MKGESSIAERVEGVQEPSRLPAAELPPSAAGEGYPPHRRKPHPTKHQVDEEAAHVFDPGNFNLQGNVQTPNESEFSVGGRARLTAGP